MQAYHDQRYLPCLLFVTHSVRYLLARVLNVVRNVSNIGIYFDHYLLCYFYWFFLTDVIFTHYRLEQRKVPYGQAPQRQIGQVM